MKTKSIGTLPRLAPEDFAPDQDLILIQKADSNQLKVIDFNLLLAAASFYYVGELNEWNKVVPSNLYYKTYRFTDYGLDSDLDTPEAVDEYIYIDVQVADLDIGQKRIPSEAKNIIILIDHSEGVEYRDERGWNKLESGQKNFVFENMQYPRLNSFKFNDTSVANKIPHSNGSIFLTPDNHAAFRCTANVVDQLGFQIYAWAY